MSEITIKDFNIINTWSPMQGGPVWKYDKSPVYLIDQSTGRKYWNEDQGYVRFKCMLLSLGTPIVHSIAAVVAVVFRILRFVSLADLWIPKKDEESYSLKNRVVGVGLNLLKVLTAPFVIVSLQLAAIFGIFKPYDGRKLYASLERFQYSRFVLAPCFQPDPKRHAFGGDPTKKNVY